MRQLAGPTGLDAAELHRLTGGNPFYVMAVIAAGVTEIPPAARDAVLARAVGLSIPARAVLDVAALTGARAEPRLVESVADCPLAAVDQALASGLLTVDGARLRFRHEIARLAVEQAISPHRRRLIHARVLDALAAGGCDDDARLAFHAEGAGDGPAVVRYASAAARQAAELASHRESAAQFERALRFAAGAAPAVVAELHGGLARELGLLDRWEDALDAVERSLGLWRQAGDRLRESAALQQLSVTMWRLCQGAESRSAAETAVAVAEPLGPSTELAWAYARLGALVMEDGQHDAAIGKSRRARALAESLGVPEVLSYALNTEACALADQGGDWTRPMRRALQVAITEGLQTQAGRAYANMYAVYCRQRRFDEAERYFAEGIAYCDEHDIGTFSACLRGERASALEKTGHWEESASLSMELLTRGGASPVNRINPLTSLGTVRARQGQPTAGDGSTRQRRPPRGAASRSTSLSYDWPAPKRTGWAASQPQPYVKPSWPMTSAMGLTPGAAERSPCGCGARVRGGHRAVTSPSPSGCKPKAATSRPPGCGPAWAAHMRPPWPCTTRRGKQGCGRP